MKVQTHFSITPPSRANPASPRAREIAAAFAGGGGLLEKKELETLRSDADDSPSEPDNQPLHLELHVSNSSLCTAHSAASCPTPISDRRRRCLSFPRPPILSEPRTDRVQPAADGFSPTSMMPSDASPRSIQTTSLMGALLFQQHQQRQAAKESSITPNASNGLKRRRVVKRDPNKPSPKAWSEEEVAQFQELIELEGPGGWEQKSLKLGGVRSAKALHTRWLREQGRIIDRPRSAASPAAAELVRACCACTSLPQAAPRVRTRASQADAPRFAS